ncbi:MAG TPA: type 4a pilus biogenesis protein PilO [Candidatus Eisenbacteria bacterium]|nr:type 4a pilus biogenesis protein PilO [Candidatus Eisenbacteria bacterium]
MKDVARAPWFGHALAVAGLAIALGVTNVAWVAPREEERKDLQAKEAALRAEISNLQEGIQELSLWRASHPEADGMPGRVKEALPAGTMVASLLDALAAIRTRHGVRTQLIQPAGAPVDEIVTDASGAPAGYRRVDLRLRLEAPYREIGNYLADVEGLDQLVVVRSVTLRYDASIAPRLVADVSLWVYGTP